MGLLWAALSPRPQAEWAATFWYAPDDLSFAAAQSALFALMAVVLGLVTGVLLAVVASRPGALARNLCWFGGALAGSGLAWLTGMLVTGSFGVKTVADLQVTAPLGLTTPGAVLIWPAAAAAITAIATIFRTMFARDA